MPDQWRLRSVAYVDAYSSRATFREPFLKGTVVVDVFLQLHLFLSCGGVVFVIVSTIAPSTPSLKTPAPTAAPSTPGTILRQVQGSP